LDVNDKATADKIMKSLSVFARKLSPRELEKLEQIINEGGDTFRMAKNFLNL